MEDRSNKIDVNIYTEGVLYIIGDKSYKEPQYIIDKVEYPDGLVTYIVYASKPNTSGSKLPVKDYKTIEVKKQAPHFSGHTILSNLAASLIDQDDKKTGQRQRIVKPPLYISYQERGTDTFTGKPCIGFKEYTPDKVIRNRFIKGEPTGVFVNEDNIRWGKPTMKLEELRDHLAQSL